MQNCANKRLPKQDRPCILEATSHERSKICKTEQLQSSLLLHPCYFADVRAGRVFFGGMVIAGAPFTTTVNGASSSQTLPISYGIGGLCGAVILIVIPIVVGVLTLRKKKIAEAIPVDVLPPQDPCLRLPNPDKNVALFEERHIFQYGILGISSSPRRFPQNLNYFGVNSRISAGNNTTRLYRTGMDCQGRRKLAYN